MKNAIGYGAIEFRHAEAGNPLAPRLIGEGYDSNDYDFVQKGLAAMPKRYFDIQALFHGSQEEFNWANGEATNTTTASVLNLFIWFDWILYLIFGYFTLINYSYFNAAKSFTSYTGATWAIST